MVIIVSEMWITECDGGLSNSELVQLSLLHLSLALLHFGVPFHINIPLALLSEFPIIYLRNLYP